MRSKKTRICFSREAFTLVEFMAAIALVGLLVAIGLPKYAGFKRRALQTEAKVNLVSIYTTERSMFREFNTYSLCLRQLGFLPTSADPSGRRYYLVGVNVRHLLSCSSNGSQNCDGYLWNKDGTIFSNCGVPDARFSAQTRLNPNVIIPSTLGDLPSTVDMTANSFTAGATGAVFENENLWDQWTIDHNKLLLNLEPRVAPSNSGSDEFFN